MHKLLGVLASSLLVLSACGGGSGGGGELSDEEQSFVDAAMADFDPEDAAPLTRDDAECIAGSFVRGLGVERLEELEITPEDFADEESSFPSGMTEEEAETVIDGFDDCVGLSSLFLDAIAEDADLSAEDKECLGKAFDDEAVREIFTKLLTIGEDALETDSEFVSSMLKLFAECPGALDLG